MSDMDNLNTVLKKKYSSEGYMDNFGGSLFIASVIIVLVGGYVGYNYFLVKTKSLKKDWPNVRCNPLTMPFAGVINGPPGGSKTAFAAQNFGHCTSEILKDVMKAETSVINAGQSIMKDTVAGLTNALQDARDLLSHIRNMMGEIFSSIFGKILNVLMPIRLTLIKSLDSINKVGGVAVTGLFTALGGALSINGFVFLFMIACIFVLLLVAGLIVAELVLGFSLMGIPFVGWLLAIPDFAIALATTIFLIAVLVLFIPLISIIVDVLYLTRTIPQHRRRLSAVQSKTDKYNSQLKSEGFRNMRHFCFDPDTRIYVQGKGYITFNKLSLDDVLSDGGRVTAIVKVVNPRETMYEINGIRVTGKHKIDDPKYGYITTENHPESQPVVGTTSSYLYSINTTTKRIPIKNIKFLDWDEVDDMDISNIRNMVKDIFPDRFSNAYIHQFMESGLDGKTQIELDDGRSVPIKDICINDQLRFGERVLGIVKINGSTVHSFKKFDFKNTRILGTDNLKIFIKDLGVISLYDYTGYKTANPKILYNIITNTQTFVVNDITLMDYTGAIEPFRSKFSAKHITL